MNHKFKFTTPEGHAARKEFIEESFEPLKRAFGKFAKKSEQTIRELDSKRLAAEIVAAENSNQLELLKEKARRDDLTGLLRRGAFKNEAEQLIASGSTSKVTVVFFDIDRFKAVNDMLGHEVGDEVLQGFVQALKNKFGDKAVISRWGGEEFVMLLADYDQQKALELFQDQKFNADITSQHKKDPLHITASVGIAELKPGEKQIESVVNRADAAMLHQKRHGRDGVVIYTDDMMKFLEQVRLKGKIVAMIEKRASEDANKYKTKMDAIMAAVDKENFLSDMTEKAIKGLGIQDDPESRRTYMISLLLHLTA